MSESVQIESLSVPPPPLHIKVNWRHVTMWATLSVLFLLFLRAVQPILMPFVLGITIAYLMDPLANRITRWGVRRNVAAAFITVSLFSVLSALVVWLGPLLYHQLMDLVAKAPALLKHLEQSTQHDAAPLLKTLHALAGNEADGSIPSSVSEVVQHVFASIGNVMSNLLASAATVVNVVALLLITPIVCFYLIRDWSGMLQRTNHLLPLAYAPTIREQLRLINQTLAAYLRGQLTVVTVMVIFYCITITLAGVNYSLLLGLVAGLLVIIPYIGTIISIGLGLIVAYGQFGMDSSWWALVGIYVVGHMLEGQYLTPKIIGDRVGLHPLWMLFGMLAGGVLLGVVGVMLAVPITAVISVLVKFAIARYLDSTLYTQP